MADKPGDGMNKALATAAAFGAATITRKALGVGWKRVTGKEPPTDPQDPQVGMAEALGWAIVIGAVMGVARVLAFRAAAGAMRRAPSKAESS
jgi:hypothetical protein